MSYGSAGNAGHGQNPAEPGARVRVRWAVGVPQDTIKPGPTRTVDSVRYLDASVVQERTEEGVAEREGFEPSVTLLPHMISSHAS